MSNVLQMGDGPARPIVPPETAQMLLRELVINPNAIHDFAFGCGNLADFCNRMLDECWPLLRAQIYQDFLFRKVPTPILEHTALVHSTPWDWDVRPCARCGKLIGTPVMKTKRAWLGNDYCVACERIILGEAS